MRAAGKIAADLVADVTGRRAARAFYRSWFDRIDDLACMGQVQGFTDELARRGVVLPDDAQAHLARHKAGLQRANPKRAQ